MGEGGSCSGDGRTATALASQGGRCPEWIHLFGGGVWCCFADCALTDDGCSVFRVELQDTSSGSVFSIVLLDVKTP